MVGQPKKSGHKAEPWKSEFINKFREVVQKAENSKKRPSVGKLAQLLGGISAEWVRRVGSTEVTLSPKRAKEGIESLTDKVDQTTKEELKLAYLKEYLPDFFQTALKTQAHTETLEQRKIEAALAKWGMIGGDQTPVLDPDASKEICRFLADPQLEVDWSKIDFNAREAYKKGRGIFSALHAHSLDPSKSEKELTRSLYCSLLNAPQTIGHLSLSSFVVGTKPKNGLSEAIISDDHDHPHATQLTLVFGQCLIECDECGSVTCGPLGLCAIAPAHNHRLIGQIMEPSKDASSKRFADCVTLSVQMPTSSRLRGVLELADNERCAIRDGDRWIPFSEYGKVKRG